MMHMPMPPGGAEVAREQMRGRHPDVVIFAGANADHLAEHRRRNYGPGTAIVLPSGRLPQDYRWPHLERVEIVAPLMHPQARRRLLKAVPDACTRTRPD